MNDTILIQQVYPAPPANESYNAMLDLAKERNRNYCIYSKMDYQCVETVGLEKYGDVKQGGWTKVYLVLLALEKGYRNVIWLDPDALIYDLAADLRDGCVDGIGACWHRIPQLEHWNVGVLYFRNSPAVVEFVRAWLDQFPGERDGWAEQGAFNRLARQSKVVQTISDRWNATLNYSMVPDAVVLGFHGCGTPPQRLELMRSALAELEKKQ